MNKIATDLRALVNKCDYDIFIIDTYNEGSNVDFVMSDGCVKCQIKDDTITIRYTNDAYKTITAEFNDLEKAANKIIECIGYEYRVQNNKSSQTLANTICAHVTIGEYGNEVSEFISGNGSKINFITHDGVSIKCRITQETIAIKHKPSLTNIMIPRNNSNCAEDAADKILECIKLEVLDLNGQNIPLGTTFRMKELLVTIKNARIALAEILGMDETYSITRICEEAADIVASALKEEPVMWNN